MARLKARREKSGAWLLLVIATAFAAAGCQAYRPSVSLTDDAPLLPTACGWDPATELAFAGWASPLQLGLEDLSQFAGVDRVFAMVTREAIDQASLGGSGPVHGRGICVLSDHGTVSMGTTTEDWTLAVLPSPG